MNLSLIILLPDVLAKDHVTDMSQRVREKDIVGSFWPCYLVINTACWRGNEHSNFPEKYYEEIIFFSRNLTLNTVYLGYFIINHNSIPFGKKK